MTPIVDPTIARFKEIPEQTMRDNLHTWLFVEKPFLINSHKRNQLNVDQSPN